ncbi:MAG: 30S ribosomal protein S2 [Planctomycetota bacterium]
MVDAQEKTTKPGEHVPDDFVDQMIAAGVHFGHRASRWNPLMKKFIYAKRNLIHIIDLKETVRGMLRAVAFLEGVSRNGGEVLIVGTKWQAQELVAEMATEAGMHWVTERWLGGTLTNHGTIRSRLKRLEELEELETTGGIENYSKKMQVRLRREKDKVFRNLQGLRKMDRLPTALIVVDARREHIALNEANSLKIPTLAIIDTDSDPTLVDIAIPGNDDAQRSLELLLTQLGDAVKRGKAHFATATAQRSRAAERPAGGGKPRTTPAEAEAPAAAPAPAVAPKLGIRKVSIPDANAAKEGAEGAPPAAPES